MLQWAPARLANAHKQQASSINQVSDDKPMLSNDQESDEDGRSRNMVSMPMGRIRNPGLSGGYHDGKEDCFDVDECFADYVDDYNDIESEDDEYNQRYPGYTRRELGEEVTFLRPTWIEESGEFEWEGKYVQWCLDNRFEEVRPGLWSGLWYWRKFPDEPKHFRPPRPTLRNRNVDEATFARIIQDKQAGNREVLRAGRGHTKGYRMALQWYEKAERGLGGVVMGIFLHGTLREELVNILSN
jgi:hypothetical protein